MSSNHRPAANDAPAAVASRKRWGWLALAAGLLVLVIITMPRLPPPVGSDVDTSLGLVLNHAHEQGWQHGTDLTFTYGPLGFLIFFYHSPHLAGLRMAVDVGLGLTVAAGICLVAWRMKLVWRVGLLGVVLWVGANAWPRTDWVINCGLYCWALLCFTGTGRTLRWAVATFALLGAFSALCKVSFLVLASVGTLFVTCDLLTRREWRLAFGTVAVFVGVFLSGWLLAGQQFSQLTGFLMGAFTVIQGYNQALGLEGAAVMRGVGWWLALFGSAAILLRGGFAGGEADSISRWRCGWRLGWIGFVAFTSWKHGMVRLDSWHVVMFLGFVPVLVLSLEALPCEQRWLRFFSRGCACIACVISLVALQAFYFPGLSHSVQAPFRAGQDHLESLVRPGAYRDQMNESFQAIREKAQLPAFRKIVGDRSVDVFGQDPGYALCNDMNYRPRPIFQSYAACNPALMKLNEQFYLSNRQPEFVLFHLHALDRKVPVLEDAMLLRHLLINYAPVAAAPDLLLLKAHSREPARLVLLREAEVEAGQSISLEQSGAESDLWLEIDLVPSLAGKMRQLLYQVPIVRLTAFDADHKVIIRHRAPAAMLAAGFVASPLLLSDDDVLSFYENSNVRRPAAYAVELPPEQTHFWKSTLHYRLYRIENRLERSLNSEQVAELRKAMTQDASQTRSEPEIRRDGLEFTLFRSDRWRPNRPPPGGLQENLTYATFLLLPVVVFSALRLAVRRSKQRNARSGWGTLLLGNLLVFAFLISVALFGAETYFRFFYDATDSLGYTKVCEKWVERHWHINAAGCRDNIEYEPARPPALRRISFLGDSFTAGHGIRKVEDRFANRLRQAHPEWQIHVLANVGLDTGAELKLLQRALTRGYQLDQVVLVYCLNDVGDLLPEQGAVYEQILAAADQSGWLVRNSYFINFLYLRYRAYQHPYLKDYFSFVREAYRGELWEKQKRRLTALRDLVQARGGHLSVVTFPFLHALEKNYEYQFAHDELDQFWREQNVPHLDLLPVYQQLPPSAVTVNAYDAHPNEYASKLAAEAIDRWLTPVLSSQNSSNSAAINLPKE